MGQMPWTQEHGGAGKEEWKRKERPKSRGNRSSFNCTGDGIKTNRQSLRVYYNVLVYIIPTYLYYQI